MLFSKEELANMKLIKDKFKGYIDTINGELISYKYASYLDINNIQL